MIDLRVRIPDKAARAKMSVTELEDIGAREAPILLKLRTDNYRVEDQQGQMASRVRVSRTPHTGAIDSQ